MNAGHEYPILKKPGQFYEILKDRHSIAAGMMEGVLYREYELQMEPGSCLFVYSDGLPEANNAEGEMFGLNRALFALNEKPDAAPEDTLKAVQRAVDAFSGQTPQFDDLTMMCLVYHGPDQKNSKEGKMGHE